MVISRRGAGGYGPDSSLKSFEGAAKLGVDGIQLDVS